MIDSIFAKIVEIIVFLWAAIKVAVAAPILVIGSLLASLAAKVSEMFCNLGKSQSKFLDYFFSLEIVKEYINVLQYANVEENKGINAKVKLIMVVLVLFVFISLYSVYKTKKIDLDIHVSSTTSQALKGALGFLFVTLLILFALYQFNKSQIEFQLASSAQGSLDPNILRGNQQYWSSREEAPKSILGKFFHFLGQLPYMLGYYNIKDFLSGYGSVIGMIVYTMFTIVLFGTIVPSEEGKVNEKQFQTTSYILAALGVLFGCFAIIRVFSSQKIAFILGLGFLAFIGYLIYYAYKHPADGFFSFDNFVTSLSLLVSLLVFYLAVFRDSGAGTMNVIFERIKYMIIFFCFIALVITYQTSAPGDIIQKYFGHLLGLTILIAIFLFMMLAILMATPVINPTPENSGMGAGIQNLLDVLSKQTWLFYLLLLVFIVVISFGFSFNLKDLKENKQFSGAVTATLIACILFGIVIFWPKTPEYSKNFVDIKDTLSFSKILLGIFGLSVVCLVIAWIVQVSKGFKKNASDESKTSSVINLLIILFVLALVYKVIVVEYPKLNGVMSWLFDALFYIPCLISKIIDVLLATYFGSATGTIPLLITLIAILFIYSYSEKHQYSFQFLFGGGQILIDDSVSLRERKIAATYKDLNPSENFNYRYAISLWAFIDAMPPNTNENYNKYASIMSFGGKPDVLYNPSLNEAIVTMKLKDVDASHYEILDLKSTVFDDNYLQKGEQIVIVDRIQKLPLQKWNNFILNCDGGTIDVFLNNELVASKIQMVPYMAYDNLTVGQDNGLYGGVYKVIYHKEPMNINQIKSSYESIVNAIRIP